MGETELRGNIMQGDGVYKSTDAGKTWKHIGLADTQAIATHSRRSVERRYRVRCRRWAILMGRMQERGVFRSRDGGKTWQKILYKNDRAGAVDLVSRSAQFAAFCSLRIWDVYRTSWTLSSGGPLERTL